jgi:hypothetical protein
MVDEVTLAVSARAVRKSEVFVGDLTSRDSHDRPGNRLAIPQPL